MRIVTLRIHHLNALTMCPAAARLPGVMPSRLVAHVLVLEDDHGLTLVDTGAGWEDMTPPSRLGKAFVLSTGARLDPGQTVLAELKRRGQGPDDVHSVVLTHLDLDHAGGLSDFPQASVHVNATELAAARARRSPRDKGRYLPAQWAHGPHWVEHEPDGDDWFGFDAVRAVSDDVLLVPLPGHTLGHSGVAVRRPGGGWYLHAGDAYFFHGEKQTPPSCPPGLKAFQTLMQTDKEARLANAARLRELHAAHSDDVTIFSAHDAAEFETLQHRTD